MILNFLRHRENERVKPIQLNIGEQIKMLAGIIRQSDFFNSDWYIMQYPSVAAESVDPVFDYLLQGYREGRNPGPEFDTNFYLSENPDVASSGQNPLVHYLHFGRDEGRLPKAGRAFSLERKLWNGFSIYALAELESLKCCSNAKEPEKIWAAWSLLVWHFTHAEYAQANKDFAFACRLLDSLKNTKKWVIPTAWCKVKLGDFLSAREILENTLRDGFNPDSCLAMSNTVLPDATPADFPDTGTFRLYWINRVFEHRDLALLQKRDSALDFNLDNLTTEIPPRSLDRRAGKISIIMPAYNSSSTISVAIESILVQTWSDIELIIVDDCSTDKTVDIAQHYAEQDNRVTVIRQLRNVGAYAARNAGVRISTGDFHHGARLRRLVPPSKARNRKLYRFSTIRDCSALSHTG